MTYMSIQMPIELLDYPIAEEDMKRKDSDWKLSARDCCPDLDWENAVGNRAGKCGKACDERLITVLNPAISTKMVERVPLGPRARHPGRKNDLPGRHCNGAAPKPLTAFTRKCRAGFPETCRRSRR